MGTPYPIIIYSMDTAGVPAPGYRSVSVKEALLDRILRLIKGREDHGYNNISEFVTDAIRRRLEQLENSEKLSFRKEPEP